VLVRWRDGRWWLRDLGSTNGTRLASSVVAAGEEVPWETSAILSLGGANLRLLDASEPRPGVLDLTRGEFHPGDASLCLIEHDGTPVASIHLEHGTQWWLETDGEPSPIEDGCTFSCAGGVYRFFSGGERRRTAQHAKERSIRAVHLDFSVSLDEEHVSVALTLDGQRLDLGARTHHYTLLTLARHRQRDALDGTLPESSQGWI